MEENTNKEETNITGDGNVTAKTIKILGDQNIDNSQNKKTAGDRAIVADDVDISGDVNFGDTTNNIFHGKQVLKRDQIAEKLWEGSKRFHKRITSKNGRFGGLTIRPDLFAKGRARVSAKAKAEGSVKKKIAATKPSAKDSSFLKDWWTLGFPHVLLHAEEGMGKTVSMLQIWDSYLKSENKDGTIPIYIALNQYNRVSREIQEKFLLYYIAFYYLGERGLDNDLEKVLVSWLKEEKAKEGQAPKLLILLDGLNEITSDITPLMIDLNEEWVSVARESEIQIVVSSRYPSNHKFSQEFNSWSLLPLEKEVIDNFLVNQSRRSDAVNELLTTPMMLSLYANIEEHSEGARSSNLKPEINTVGELLWNFVERKLASFEEDHNDNPEECARNHFLIQYLLPYIAFQMEKEETLDIKEKDLEGVIRNAFIRFCEPDFFTTSEKFRKNIKRYRRHIRALQIGELPIVEEISRFEKLMADFKRKLYPVTWEGVVLRFYHQSFQDFFVAKHILNELNLSLEKKELPAILKERILPTAIRKMLGEITGEHYNKPTLLPKGKKWNSYYQKTSLMQALDLCRGIFDPEALEHLVWNILTICKEVRGELSGTDLSELHLGVFDFNGVSCAQTASDGTLVKCNWNNSRLSPNQLFPQGHQSEISKVRISSDGKLLITASNDASIKLWSVETNHFIRSFQDKHGHNDVVHSISFSPDNKRILSGGADNKVIEWSVETGQCLQVYRGHADTVREVIYHPSEEKILSASEDGTIWEWSKITGKCVRTYKLSYYGKLHTLCYIKEGRSILVGSEKGKIIELPEDTASEQLTYGRVGVQAMTCSPCGGKLLILSISQEKKEWFIEEWNVGGRSLNKTFSLESPPAGRKNVGFCDVAYSPCGQYVLVAGLDDNIYEWSVKDHYDRKQCTASQIFKGHVRQTTSIAYHPNGKQFYSGANDATIENWSTLTGQCLHSFQPQSSPFNDISDLPNSPWLVAGSEDGTIHRWSLGKESLMRDQIFKGDAPAYSMAYYYIDADSNQNRLISGGEWGIIQVWSMDGQCLRRFNSHPTTVTSLALDQDTGMVVSADKKGHLILWSLEDDAFEVHYPKQKRAITHVSFSPKPGDKHFVTSDYKGILKLWLAEEESTEAIGTSFEHGSRVFTVDFDGSHILSGGRYGKVKEFDLESGKETTLWEDPEKNGILYVAYSPDQQRILVCVSGSNVLLEFPFKKGGGRSLDLKAMKIFQGHENYIIAAKYGKSNETILTISQDCSLKEWNSATGECIRSIQNIPGLWVAGLDFREVRWTEPLTDEEWDLLELYGAKLVDKDYNSGYSYY